MPSKIELQKIATRAPQHLDKIKTKEKLEIILQELNELQNLFFANATHSILMVIQGMDASGKDGLIRDVCSTMNPQGVQVHSFKEPTAEELAHDFLWRVHRKTPAKGFIQIFNRSHYEDVLITRVHGLIDDDTAQKRMQAIHDFERLLTRHNHTHILKFYLHVSHEEQLSRLNERLRNPKKMWKYNPGDLIESEQWDNYMRCYEEAINRCNEIPWHIIPADQNWYKSYTVAKTLRDLLKSLNLKYPGLKK
jgi:PPK2 family polyphosphate:nucleotide phosphotransferase